MSSVQSLSQYDSITSEDLFDSFMTIALNVENENINNISSDDCSTYASIKQTKTDNVNAESIKLISKPNHVAKVTMPLPLMVKLQPENIYKVCNDNNGTEKTINVNLNNYATIEFPNKVKSGLNTKTNTDTSSLSLAESNGYQFSVEPTYKQYDANVYDSVAIEPVCKVTDIYAVPDKTRKTEASKVINEYAVPDKTENVEASKVVDQYAIINKNTKQNIEISNVIDASEYAIPDQINKNDNKQGSIEKKKQRYSEYAVPDTGIELSKNVSDSGYAQIDEKISNKKTNANIYGSCAANNSQEVLRSSSSEGKPVATVSPIMVPECVLNAEQVAFGRHNSKGVREMYKTCLQTIERGSSQDHVSPCSRSTVKEKKHFFGFGKSKHSIDHSSGVNSISSPARPKRWSTITEAEYDELQGGEQVCKTPVEIQSSNLVLCSGYLFKQGGTGFTPKNWRLRWFELKQDNCLYYYKNEQDPFPNGAVLLFKYAVARASEVNKRFAFKVVKGGARTYYFAANAEDEMKKWMKNVGVASRNAISDETPIPECSLKNVSIPAVSITEPDCHGFLWKQGGYRKRWRKRYCVLKYSCLFYYEDMSDQSAIGVFKLHNYVIEKTSNLKFAFEAIPPNRKMRTYNFHGENEIDSKRWIESMKHSIESSK